MTTHAKISYVKSFIRLIGFIYLPINLLISSLFLIIAEIVGIVEEIYE